MVSCYLFALSMGLLSLILVYLDSLQTKQKTSKTTYIKVFIATSVISLATAMFYQSKDPISSNVISSSPLPQSGGSNVLGELSRQQILTGNPDF